MNRGSATTDRLPLTAQPESPRATLAQVAEVAGVSIATASRVLNKSPRVSPDASKRVAEAAAHLGYRRQRAAWHRGGDRAGAIAIVIHASHRRLFTDPFFPRLITATETRLNAQGVPMLVMSVTEPSAASVGRYLNGGHVDGVVIVSDHGPSPLCASIASLGLPVAVVGRPPQPCGLPYVDADNRGGARAAVEYLIRRGRRGIVHIGGPASMTVGADRFLGYLDAVCDGGFADHPVAYGDFGQASGAHAMARLLDQRPHLDAVFAASDAMAAGAIAALRRAGRRVPDDVAVVGFDDHLLAQHVRPPLTTVRQPIEELAAVATGRLLSGADDRDAIVLPTTLITRQSA